MNSGTGGRQQDAEPLAGDVMSRCAYCRAPLPEKSAVVCKECGNIQVPQQIQRSVNNFIAMAMLRLFPLAIIVAVLGLGYQWYDNKAAVRRQKAADLVEYGTQIQTLSEQLRQPCLLDSDGCKQRFDLILRDFTRATYAFRDTIKFFLYKKSLSYRSAANLDYDIDRAIDFIDDFYNPGDAHFQKFFAFPLQIELLRSRPLLTAPYDKDQWCSIETRQQVRALMLSVDVYRYCQKVLLRYAIDVGDDVPLMPLRPTIEVSTDAQKLCLSPTSLKDTPLLLDKANRIAAAIGSLSDADQSAPWNYDSYCQGSTVQGGLIPTVVRQLVVAVAEGNWNASAASLFLYERDGSTPGSWKLIKRYPQRNRFNKNGLAWAHGMHAFPSILIRDTDATAGPTKFLNDGRSVAGLFLIEVPSQLGRTGFKIHTVQGESEGQNLYAENASALSRGTQVDDAFSFLAAWLKSSENPAVVQLPREIFDYFASAWSLPEIPSN